MTSPTTFNAACLKFLSNVEKSMPSNTLQSYKSDLLGSGGFIPSLAPSIKLTSPIGALTEEHGVIFLQSLLDLGLTPATRRRRASTLREFFRFVSYEYDLPISVDRLKYKIKSLHLLTGSQSTRSYPADKIRKMLAFAGTLRPLPDDLVALRDLAFILTLAQTGLRVHEAVALRVGSIDRDYRATIIGKGGKQATVTWGKDARGRLNAYLKARVILDGSTGRLREMVPLFARHDQTSGKNKVKSITIKIGEKIVHNMAALALGDGYDPAITCHALRHYFGTEIYKITKDVKATQKALRHAKSSTTLDIYVHRNDEEVAEIVKSVFG